MIFTFGNFKIDVDVEKTREFYSSDKALVTSKQCTCNGCQNYDRAIMTAPTSILDFLRNLGIDPQKPGEVFGISLDVDSNGLYWYGGWYHIVGTILEGCSETKSEDTSNAFIPDSNYNFLVWFTDDKKKMGWIEKDFPTPILELSISAKLPWLL
ncbi:MAG: hypothetical protein IJF21_01365 [Clostridia bacterium]|nr:hypothetical protein [Clostridia bacterium]